jgi:serine kinase
MAVKIIDRRKAPPDFLNRFLPRELDIYFKLKHTNIIRVQEIIQISHRVFIFMELAEGGDLLDYIKVKLYLRLKKRASFCESCLLFFKIVTRCVVK